MEFCKYKHIKKEGFTLIEVLIVVGIISIVFGFGTVAIAKSQEHAKISSESEKIMQIVRETQNLSLVSEKGKSWGLRCMGNNITRFYYDPEQTSETIRLTQGFSCSTTSDIRFKKLTNVPSVGDVYIILNFTGKDVKRIEIKNTGTITSSNI